MAYKKRYSRKSGYSRAKRGTYRAKRGRTSAKRSYTKKRSYAQRSKHGPLDRLVKSTPGLHHAVLASLLRGAMKG